jgi:hypothetical protein
VSLCTLPHPLTRTSTSTGPGTGEYKYLILDTSVTLIHNQNLRLPSSYWPPSSLNLPLSTSAKTDHSRFIGCTSSSNNTASFAEGPEPIARDFQGVVNWCADIFVAFNFYTPRWFAIHNWYDQGYYCYVSSVPVAQFNSRRVDCKNDSTLYNFAVYFPA